MLKEEMETLGPVRMKEVSDAQQAITAIIQEMEAKGEVIVGGRRGNRLFLDGMARLEHGADRIVFLLLSGSLA